MADLVPADVRFHRSFIEAAREEPGAASYLFTGDESTLADPDVFADYVAMLRADELETSPRPDLYVPGTNLWWVEGDRFIGRLAIRHRLNERLRTGGGHIGYWIRPSERRRGHAGAAFRAALPRAHRLGIDPALVSCDADNVGSRKIIESTGGVFERQLGELRLYWVPTGSDPSL
ncbi:GNAT family N-acetyltransferase [Microlunatus elymi]|uniref:GNAT family N-acetyltransferase n=1 Tax=Microlunatus elymi TaxID=2596828 RepID=UPI001D180056|nr:GNAT family N-acetyltransferase [Microlunatus elymi]